MTSAAPTHAMSRNGDLLMMSISTFYAQKGVMNKILAIINGSSKQCSLRLVDWFVTNYARAHNTIITNRINNNIVHFNVYLSYRSQLKAYSKQQFDPFRRRERILFYYERDKSVETTIGQLNFFRWVLQNNLLDYIISHQAAIEQDMVVTQKQLKSQQFAQTTQTATASNASTSTPIPLSTAAPTLQARHAKTTTTTTTKSHGHAAATPQPKARANASGNNKTVPSTKERKKSKHASSALRNVNMSQLGTARMISFD